MKIEAEQLDKEELLDEFGEPIEPPKVNPFLGYDDPVEFIYDSMVGFCQMISRHYKKEFKAGEQKSNLAGLEAVKRCVVNINKRVDGVPYIDVTPQAPTLTDYYEHNMMHMMGAIIEPAIPDEFKPDNDKEMAMLFLPALERLQSTFKSQIV